VGAGGESDIFDLSRSGSCFENIIASLGPAGEFRPEIYEDLYREITL